MRKKLGDALRTARVAKGMTMRKVERLSGGTITNPYIGGIEAGKYNPAPQKLRTLAEIYDVSFIGLLILAGHLKLSDVTKFMGKKVSR